MEMGAADRRAPKSITAFHVMAKPTGALCNLDCAYCFYLHKQELINSRRVISDEVLERFIYEYINSQTVPEIVFTWQGGEPTLLGVDFFRRVVEYERLYCPPGKKVANDLQTNGTLLDEKWCEFLKEHNFLVGISIDGPERLHNVYRKTRRGDPTFQKVFNAIKLLHKYEIPFNTLTVVNRINAKYPREVYRFLRDTAGSTRMQFIPIAEPKVFNSSPTTFISEESMPTTGSSEALPGKHGSLVADWSVVPEDYGSFLNCVFDIWYREDIGKVFVFLFECALAQWLGMEASLCIFSETCGRALALEADGSLYSCDHFVYPEHRLGNIKDHRLLQMVTSTSQTVFGVSKAAALPEYCNRCEYLFACHGECPKNRFVKTPDGEPGLNYLCAGLKKYFHHIYPYMKELAEILRATKQKKI
ncbi:anaerobic sulfatase maturase [Mesotoga sp. B105.6.4]|uniref:anaerobic sulfatase maturase n=1 Tax=Mesotoga sp. B105.6.4 TaxID=1582224 RepID=UPI000CCC8B73|nr:anaerobic sulfatase maturase [Mesotoga sp. B105.6.4]PNS39547.1 sulfatase maturase [Mesotoga sp. B105.6.4]